jgi:hypothetical protein
MSGNVLAQADQHYFTNGDDPTNGPMLLSFPLDDQLGNKLGSTFTLQVAVSPTGGSVVPTKSFYIIDHHAGPWEYGQPEAEGPTGSGQNDTAATAESVSSPGGVTGGFFVDGNLSAPGDVDWYAMSVPTGVTKAYLYCSCARAGSGLRGFTGELFDAAGATSLGKVGPETWPPKSDLSGANGGYPIGTNTKLTLKIGASFQDPNVKGTYYHCSVSMQ